MPVFALYNFDETGAVVDSALGNGAQDGIYLNGASASGGELVLDGENDFAKIYPDPSFQLTRGTLEVSFTTGDFDTNAVQTVLSRDSAGQNDGSFRVEVASDGSVTVTHETGAEPVVYTTGPGFFVPGDTLELSYSWDEGGEGGVLVLENATAGTSFEAEVPNTLSLDMGSQNPGWTVGAGQQLTDPVILNDINQHFSGTVEVFSLSDSVDNLPEDPDRDGIVRGTTGGDLIDTGYVDPFDGDQVDANDALISGDAPNDDRVRSGEGNDTVLAGIGDDTVWAGYGDDEVFGQDGDDDLRGNAGNDSLTGGNGNDIVYGQQGDDVIDTSGTASPLPDIDYPGLYPADADPTNDLDTVYGGLGNDSITTGDDADVVYGDDGRDTIDGGIDNDSLFGGQGGDFIVGGEGADAIDGGMGSDVIYGGLGPDAPDAINIRDDEGDLRPNNGNDSISGGTGADTIYGLDDDDTIAGGIGNDVLFGGIDEDEVRGDEGDDRITGGQGTDTLSGGADRDTFLVGSATDGAGDVIDGNEEGDDFDTLDLRGSGPLTITYADDNPENGRVDFRDAEGNVTSSLTFTNIENVIPCFTPGTLIATPKGEMLVENLSVGDKIITRDNGIQEIR
jgi:Ca2+-binding RTX toxin-like protein